MAPPARSTWTTHPGTFDPLALSAVWQAPIGRPPENQIPLLPLPSPRCQRLRVHRSPPPQPLNLDRKTTDSAEFVGISGPALQYQRILAVDFIEPLDREIHTVYPMSPPEGGGSTR